ncbi:leucine-rich repeat protein [Methanosarcina siciliae]|nr:leucine-rich repeat protein [Methanosarcina siciliae]
MQKKRFFVLTTVMLLLSIAMLAMPAVAIGEATITRTITPSEVSDGDTYNVTLTVSFNIDEDSIAIHEDLPADWNLTEVDSGRYIWNTSKEDYTFLDFYGTVNLTGVADTITYSVTVPDETVSGTYDYGPSYIAGESASEEEYAWTVNTTGDDTVTINGTILNIYSTAMENTNPGAPDPGIPGFVGPNGDGKTDCGTVNPIFMTWASTVVDYSPADQSITESFSDPGKTLGPVTGDNFDIVSLGDLDQDQINAGELPGSVTLGFDLPIADGEGPDLAVFENGFIVSGTESIFAELAYVEVSTDGIVFARFPSISLTSGQVGGYGSIDPTYVYNLVGKHVNAYGDSWGTPFDLSTLAQAPEVLNGSVDLNSINYVRIVDIPGSGDFKDSQGNPIYDGWVTWGSGGLDLEAVGVINIGVASAPVADFTSDVTSGTAPLTVQFNDASTGVILDYAWDFDNDGIVDSTLQNPSFTYEAAGTYNVSLTASNTGGSNTETKAGYIVSVLPDSPVADFSVDVTSGPAPLTVQFTDLTTNKPVSWAWDFESDGIIDSYEQNPSWTYYATGNYTVTLTAANLAASDTFTRVNLTSVVNLPPMADFSADPVATLIGCSVQFTDLSTNSPTSWQWDFNNDGTIDSTMQNPSYTYTTAGTYTVNLTVSNPVGSGDEVKTDYIIVKEQASPASDFTYTSDGSSITITKYIGSDGIVIIPGEIEGLPVTTIGTSAFQDCSALTTVSIPDSITTIGDYAFMRCSALTTVSIPNSVISIGKYAFSGCSALTTVAIGSGVTAISEGVFYNCPSVTTVTIGSSVTTIGTSAFQGCSALTTVSIPDSVTIIGGSAFQGCSALTTVNIPDSVTIIGGSAFQGCSALTTVTIGSGVTGIGNYVFLGCSALTAIGVDTDNSVYVSIDGVLYNKEVTTLIRCPPGKTGSVTIQNSVTAVGYCAFYGCTALTSMTIPDGVTSIDNYAFMSCTALTSMVFMGNAPDVGSSWASGCTDLVVYYQPSATGFTTPTWNGVACYPISAPTAEFTSNVVYGSAPLTVHFTDLSTGDGITTWAWDFDSNGNVDSTEQNPSHTYISAGNYTVDLTVANANGTDSEVKTDYITVSESSTPEEPVSAFTADVTGGTAPLTVNFTDQSTGSPTAWDWDFDNDGNVDSTEQNPSYTYNAAGNYTVNLTVENEAGSDFELKSDYIEVSEASGSTVTLYFDPESSSVSENESTEINIVASNFPAGFSGYNLTVALDNPAVAEIVDIKYPTWALITENSSLPGTSIYLKTVDGGDVVKEGAADVVLVILTVSGKEYGSANLSIGIDRLDDDSGETIEPEFLTGKIEVTLLSPLPDQEYAPKDLDGDGLYEDLTGNGEFSFVDIVAYFHNMDWIEENMPVEYFDFNGNGRIDFDDVVNMFAMI